jgi:phospholipid/cholesterol/gamma-HCH transport system ATP-binding protein
VSFWKAKSAIRERIIRKIGVLYQSGALWSSMTLADNVALPLEQYKELSREIATAIKDIL